MVIGPKIIKYLADAGTLLKQGIARCVHNKIAHPDMVDC
jgi:hypothetical protein